MNEVYVIGKIIKVEYMFIYKGKYTSIAKGFIKVKNQEIPIMAIDDLADKLYIYIIINSYLSMEKSIITVY